MKRAILLSFGFLAACGATEFKTFDPYADAGSMDADAGSGGGGATGGGTATGGGGGVATGGGGGSTTGGGGGSMTGGGGGSTTGGGGGSTTGGGGGSTTGGGGGSTTGGGGGSTGGGGGTACGPSTCSGCCANGVCQATPTAAQCGSGGGACTACSASEICKANGACGIDPASTWRIRPVSAVINSSVSWDDFSDPDTELYLWCPETSNTEIIFPLVSDDYTPSWSGGCDLTAGEIIATGIGLGALEVDSFSDDVLAPYTAISITEADLRAGTKTTGVIGGMTSITFSFTKQ